jgi:hypothetical protein
MRFPRLAHRSAAAHKLHSTPQQDRMNLISGNRETSSRLPALAYSPRRLSKRPAPSQFDYRVKEKKQNLLAAANSDFTNQQGPIPLSTVPEPTSRASQSCFGCVRSGMPAHKQHNWLYGNARTARWAPSSHLELRTQNL